MKHWIRRFLVGLYGKGCWLTYVITPESVVDARNVNGQQAERNAAQVVGQPAVVRVLRVAAERVVARRHGHTNL